MHPSCRHVAVVGGRDPGGGSSWDGHVRHVGSVRQSLHLPGQEEEVRDEGPPEDSQSDIQRDVRVQGKS